MIFYGKQVTLVEENHTRVYKKLDSQLFLHSLEVFLNLFPSSP